MVSESGPRMVPTRSHDSFADNLLIRPLPAHVQSKPSDRSQNPGPDKLRLQETTDLEAARHLYNTTGEPDASTGAVDREKGRLETKDRSNISRKMKSKASTELPASQVKESSHRSYFLHLCWEHAAHDQRALVVKFSNPEDEMEIYESMRQKWYAGRRWWLKFAPFYNVISLEEVEVGSKSNVLRLLIR